MFKQAVLVALALALTAHDVTEANTVLLDLGSGSESGSEPIAPVTAPKKTEDTTVQPTVAVDITTGTVKQVVTYPIEGTLSEMSEADISTTKSNIQAAFLLAAGGAIAAEDIESITLVQAPARSRARRAGTINVIITLKDTVDKSAVTTAAATPVVFEVVVGGVATKVTVTGAQQGGEEGGGTNFENPNNKKKSGSKGSDEDAIWIGVIVGIVVLVAGGVFAILRISRPPTQGFVHYDSSITSSQENKQNQELLANF